MKLLVCLLLSFILVAECDFLSNHMAKFKLEVEQRLSSTQSQKRQALEVCPQLNCLNQGQACKSDPFDSTPCQPCIDALTTCVIAANGNETISCNCVKASYNCFISKGGICLSYPSGFAPSCPSFAGPNCNCTPPFVANYPITTCKFNYDCLNNTVCSTKPTYNETCSTAIQDSCGDGFISFSSNFYTCSNTTHRCVRKPDSVAVGDACTSSMDCIGSNFSPQRTSCTGGVCVGVAVNGACNMTKECNFGLYCKNSVCKTQLAPGSNCTAMDNSCTDGYVCGFEKTCIPQFSKAIGASCVVTDPNSDQLGGECAFGSFCSSATNKCIAPSSPVSCNFANDTCAVGTTCSCSYNGVHQCLPDNLDIASYISPSCKPSYDALLTCLTAASCKGDPTATGCATRNCNNQVQCFFKCYIPSIAAVPSISYCIDTTNNYVCNTGTSANAGTSAGTNAGTSAGTNAGTDGTNGGTSANPNTSSPGTNAVSTNSPSASSTLVVITWFIALLLVVAF